MTIPFEVSIPGGAKATANFVSSLNLDPEKRLYPVVSGILGKPAKEGMDLRKLAGRSVQVTIAHRCDEKGNTWADVVKVTSR